MMIVCIRDFPDLLERAVDYFAERWKIDKQTYYKSIKDNIYTEKAYPR